MEITLKVNKDFERYLNELQNKYGEDFEILNGIHSSQTNYSDFIDAFIDKNVADVSIDANANASNKDICSLLTEKSKSHDKIFALNKIFFEMKKKYGLKTAKDWLEQEYNGGFYLHDASSATYKAYCFAYDVSRLAKEGLFFLKNYNAIPPKHLSTFIDDVIEFISFMSNRSSGAVGLPNVLVWMFYFWNVDKKNNYYSDSKRFLKQNFQKFIYRLNQPFMRIDQTAFVNVSIMDRNYVEALFGGLEFPDGSLFIDMEDEFMEFQKIFMDVISEIRHENAFTFPVLTFCLLHDGEKFVDEEFARWSSNHNMLWNDSNFFISKDVTSLSNCCRLISSMEKLKGWCNSIGGGDLSIGSIKVSTINLVRIAYESGNDIKKYLQILKKRTLLDCKLLDVQRHIIKRNIEKGLLPNYCEGGMDMSHQYSTIGILGLYETIEKFGMTNIDEFGNVSYTDEGVEFGKQIFKVLNDVKDSFECDFSWNIESVPAERAAVILCQKDNLLYDTKEKFIYSNQWIPLSMKTTIKEKLRTAAIFDPLCSGGAIAHINIESNFPNEESAWDMLNKIAESGVMYFAFNTKISSCKHNHMFVGTKTCPECGEPAADTWCRIVGFLRPTSSFSKERKMEYSTRQWFEYANLLGEQ